MMLNSHSICTATSTLLVGEERQKIHIHEHVLKKSSEAFNDAMYCQGMKRNGEPIYPLIMKYGYEDVVTYVHWLYTGKIPTSACN
jgi:hypothetical protein